MVTLLLVSITYGQVLERQVIGSSGTAINNTNTILNFTIGEPVIGTIATTNNEVKQGFWHTSVAITLSNDDFINDKLSLQLFPNPVSDYLNINFTDATTSNYTLDVYDMTGKRQMNATMLAGENQHRMNIQHLASGIYLISVTQLNTNNTNTYRIIKK